MFYLISKKKTFLLVVVQKYGVLNLFGLAV